MYCHWNQIQYPKESEKSKPGVIYGHIHYLMTEKGPPMS